MMTKSWTCWRDAGHANIKTHEFGWPRCGDCGAAPPYYERPNYLDDRLNLIVFVPKDGKRLSLNDRTAIVGVVKGDYAAVDYEGWVYGPAQYADRDARGLWEAGVEHAASRMITDYPTSARMVVPLRDVEAVGIYLPKRKALIVENEEAVSRWLQ